MDEQIFERLAADELKALERALTDLDGLDADLHGDVLELEFEDGRQFIVNSHRAARQVWLSANARAWHFSRDEASGRWIDTREGHELWALVTRLVSEKLRRPLQLK